LGKGAFSETDTFPRNRRRLNGSQTSEFRPYRLSKLPLFRKQKSDLGVIHQIVARYLLEYALVTGLVSEYLFKILGIPEFIALQ
jgi:hypothetical protein